jgi:hypothetical protein
MLRVTAALSSSAAVAMERNPLSPPMFHSAAQPGPERPQWPAVCLMLGRPIGQQ